MTGVQSGQWDEDRCGSGGGIPGSFACDPVSAEFPGGRPRDRDDRRVESGHLMPRDVDGCEAVLPLGGFVANSNTMLAVVLAAATLVVFVVVIAMGGALRAGLAPWPGIGIAVLAIAAFAVSRERRSFVVAGLLGASGVVGVVYALIRTEFLMDSSFPGPIFGIILGLLIVGLAVAEAVGATRDRRSREKKTFIKTPTPRGPTPPGGG